MAAPAPRDHLIVCGDSSLAYRIASELAIRYGERVTVILPSRRRNMGPQIAELPGVHVLERRELDTSAFEDAGVESARALALAEQDDLGNFHAALRATELNPALRLVLAVFNPNLGDRIRGFFPDCAVLMGTAMSAPYFVAAALGQPAPSHVRVAGRTLYVARRADIRPTHVMCALAAPSADPADPVLLPPMDDAVHLVLAVADGTPRNPLTRRRGPARLAAGVRHLGWSKFGVVFMVLLTVILVGFALLQAGPHYSLINATYLTLMDLTGSALTNPGLSGPEKVSQVILTVDGMAFIPVVTALVVGARLTGTSKSAPQPRGDHIIVVGLGNVGTRVVGQLHDLGFGVACVDSDPNARGIPMARRLGLPVILGQGYREETLRAAGVATCVALITVTSSDGANLETALQARALREDLRIVLRLNDDDFAQRVQEAIGNTVSRSVSYLAAPAFAAALLEHQVLRTVAVGRHVLLIAELLIEPGAKLSGRQVADAEGEGLARVLAVRDRGQAGAIWSPPRDRTLAPGDRMIIIATRAGLQALLTASSASVPSPAEPASATSATSATEPAAPAAPAAPEPREG